jgi:hypothetical protein
MKTDAEEKLQQLFADYQKLRKSIQLFSDAWSSDETIRNRPDRQSLTGELCGLAMKPLDAGRIFDKIEKSTNLKAY